MSAGKPVKNTVPEEALAEIKNFIRKHIEPDDNPGSMLHHGYDWFYDHFDFIPEDEIRSQLAQAFYQSRFVHKLLVALKLDGRESYPLLLLQLFEYASIFEALTDYIIRKKYMNEEDFREFKSVKEIRRFPRIYSNTWKLICKSSSEEEIFFAYEKEKELQLRDIRFSDRIGYTGKKIGLSKAEINKIAEIYDIRNHIHLLKAADDNFVPKHDDGKNAFKITKKFIEAIKTELLKP